MRLFCFPYAGAGPSVYRAWAGLLPEVEVRPVSLPGREGRARERPATDVHEAVERLARELAPELAVPFAFFGHSMGALLAFELTRHLRRTGQPLPRHLIVSGREAPHMEPRETKVHLLPEKEFREKLRRLNGTPPEIWQHPELLALLLPLLRADFAVCENYVYSEEAPLSCPIAAFGGTEDAGVGEEAIQGWTRHSEAGGEVAFLPGDHFFLVSARESLLRHVGAVLTRSRASSERATSMEGGVSA